MLFCCLFHLSRTLADASIICFFPMHRNSVAENLDFHFVELYQLVGRGVDSNSGLCAGDVTVKRLHQLLETFTVAIHETQPIMLFVIDTKHAGNRLKYNTFLVCFSRHSPSVHMFARDYQTTFRSLSWLRRLVPNCHSRHRDTVWTNWNCEQGKLRFGRVSARGPFVSNNRMSVFMVAQCMRHESACPGI